MYIYEEGRDPLLEKLARSVIISNACSFAHDEA